MSRIGQAPIPVPTGVDVTIDGQDITVTGPKGTLSRTIAPTITVSQDDGALSVTRPDDERQNRALHGLTRSLINNMVVGVTKGYEKRLKIEGIGYQATLKNKGVELTVGYANKILKVPPE